MFSLTSRLFLDADAATTPPIRVSVCVLFGVFVTVYAVSLVGPVVSSLPDNVSRIFGTRIPAQVLQSVVRGIGIGMMAPLFAWKRLPHKGTQNQAVNAESSARIAGEGNSQSAAIHHYRFENPARNYAGLPITAGHTAIQRSNAASVGHFKLPFVSHYRKPSFSHAVRFYIS